jgi:ElaB/YqjD/DUF883 family membrane-anchored ribosome-binding protein
MGQTADTMSGYDSAGDADLDLDAGAVTDTATGDTGTDEDNTGEIRAQIEQTRSEMSDTINAIQDKLSPDNLKDQAKEMVREATIGRAEEMVNNAGDTAKGLKASVMETIRQNPVPAAIAGISLGWLFMNRANGGSNSQGQYSRGYSYDRMRYSSGYPGAGNYSPGYNTGYGTGYDGGRGNSSGIGEMASQAKDTVGDVAAQAKNTVGDVAGQAASTVGDVASQAASTVGDVASQARDTVGDVAGQAQYRAQQATYSLQNMLQDNPLAVGAVAVALGAAVGFIVPETQQEHQLLGQARDTLVDKAQTVAQDTVQKVQNVAEEATQTVQQEAQNPGLTS